MDFLSQKEYQKLTSEKELAEDILMADKIFLEKKLNGGLGEELRNYLENPVFINEKEEKRIRKKRKRKIFWRNLKALLFNKTE